MSRRLSQSPQARWARKMMKQGRCRVCGQKRTRHLTLCDYHQRKFNAYMKGWRARRNALQATTTTTTAESSTQS